MKSRITREIFASSLKALLSQRTLSKISVKDITEHCELSRNTFYYHFKDKYELINWIFYDDMIRNVNSFQNPSKLTESFLSICQCLYKNRDFYFACFQYVGQNSLYESIQDMYYELWKMNLSMRYMNSNLKISEEELELMARLNTHALVGIISEWIRKGMQNNYIGYFEQVKLLLDMEYFMISGKGGKEEKQKIVA